MNNKLKKKISVILVTILCISLNVNPLSILISSLVTSEIFSSMNILFGNVMYVTGNGISKVLAFNEEENENGNDIRTYEIVNRLLSSLEIEPISEEENGVMSSSEPSIIQEISVSCDHSTIEELISETNKQLEIVNEGLHDDKAPYLEEILETIRNSQFKYRVANIWSANNKIASSLWRPTTDEIPYFSAIPYATVGYSNVYTGYWDSGITDIKLSNKIGIGQHGIADIDKPNSGALRALEVLGYDALVRNEGYSKSDKFSTSSETVMKYVQTLIDKTSVTWGDAIQVIYKALGQYIYSYSYVVTADNSIKPETSPLAQDLNGINKSFDTSYGRYELFISRSNQYTLYYDIDKDKEVAIRNDLYWDKAINDGFVRVNDIDNIISGSELIVLASTMMQVYGESVLNDMEVNLLLQVYGLDYPIQMGTRIADAWAYLKARGVLNVDINYSGCVTREELLDIAMCIADPSSRTDYKNIQLTLNIDNSLVSKGFYPVNNLNLTNGGFTIQETIDYSSYSYYDYFLLISDVLIPKYENSTEYLTPKFTTSAGTTQPNLYVTNEIDAFDSGILDGSSYLGVYTDKDNNSYYHFRVPYTYSKKDKKGNDIISINSTYRDDSPPWIDIPQDNKHNKGGIYTGYVSRQSPNDNEYGLLVDLDSRKSFDSMENKEWLFCVDSERAGRGVKVVESDSFLDKLASLWDKWTTPMYVNAATATLDLESSKLIVSFDKTSNSKNDSSIKENSTSLANKNSIYTFLDRTIQVLKDPDWVIQIKSEGYSSSDFKSDISWLTNYALERSKYEETQSAKKLYENESKKTLDRVIFAKESPRLQGAIDYKWGMYKDVISDLSGLPKEYLNDIVNATLEQTTMIYDLIRVGKVTEIKRIKVLNENGREVPTNDFEITCGSPIDVKNILGKIVNFESLQSEIEGSDLGVLVTTSSIMSRRENILISWTDLLTNMLVVDTFKGSTPIPRDEGAYYIQTNQGIAKINPLNYTIVIGTTYYNLANEDGTGPTLVYHDSETGEVYFDYRCVMGISTLEYEKSGTTLTSSSSSIGSGSNSTYVVHSLSKSSTIMTTRNTSSYNYPNTPSDKSGDGGFTTVEILETKYDGKNYKDAQITDSSFTYWGDTEQKSGMRRIALSSFCPTANWITVIKQNDSGTTAKLFVWYLDSAFNNTSRPEYTPEDVLKNAYDKTLSNKTYGEESLSTKLSITGLEDKSEWYNNMTKQAVSELWELTNGGLLMSGNYVIRGFDITRNSAYISSSSYNEDVKNGNSVGAIYWLEGIGYVYNCPSKSSYNHKDYLEGKLPLPVAKNTYATYDQFIFTNVNNYDVIEGSGMLKYSGYGYCLGMSGLYDVFNLTASLIVPSFGLNTNNNTKLPYNISNLVLAPAGVYAFFGGSNLGYENNENNSLGVKSSTNKYYFGNSLLIYDDNNSIVGQPKFYLGCRQYESIEMDGDFNFYQVYQGGNKGDILICLDGGLISSTGGGVSPVTIGDMYTNDIYNWFDELGFTYLLDKIDNTTSWVIVFAFEVLPIIGILLMTALIGLAFISDTKIVRLIVDKTIDPIKLLTFGTRTINDWSWKKVMIPCILLYISFALILNGNLLRIVEALVTWYGVIKEMFMQLT